MRLSTFTSFLTEDKVEWLKANTPKLLSGHDFNAVHREPGDIIDHFAAHDPHPKKNYTPWMISQYKKQNVRQEDAPRLQTALTNFDRYKGRLDKKDINQYGDVGEVESAVEPHVGGAASKKEEKRITKVEGADLVHDAGGMTVHHLKTEGAAKLYGKGAKWCTNGECGNMFGHYNKQGPIHVIHTDDGQKFQFHFASSQFKDPTDRDVEGGLSGFAKRYPEVKNVKAFHGLHPALEDDAKFNERTAAGHTYKVGYGGNGIEMDAKGGRVLTPDTLEKSFRSHSSNPATADLSHIKSIAGHPNARPSTLSSIADFHVGAHQNLAKNPSTDSETLDRIYNYPRGENLGELGSSLAEHPNLSTRTKLKMMDDPQMHKHLLKNPSLEQEHVGRIFGKSLEDRNELQRNQTHEAIAAHPNTHPDHLAQIATGKNHLAASAALKHPNLPEHVQDSLMASGSDAIKAAMAKNPGIKREHLETLTGHKQQFIADTAKKTLKGLPKR